MIVLRSPKGWTGPKVVDGLQIEGTFRAHQVPLAVDAAHPEHLPLLERWLKSYQPGELFDPSGRLKPELAELAPSGARRMGAIRTPTAACCCGTCGCRNFDSTRPMCRHPERPALATPVCWAASCAT